MMIPAMPTARRIGAQRDRLGECPILDGQGRLCWIDGEEPSAIQRIELATGRAERWSMPARIGSFVLRQDGGALVALRDGVHAFDFTTGATRPLARVEQPHHFFLNDGRCDPAGRFFVTSMNLKMLEGDREARPVFRFDGDRLTPVIDGVIAGNGMAFSRDGRTMYVGCSLQATVWALDLDPETGEVSNRRVFARVDRPGCFLDGAAVDAEDHYWICIYGAGLIERYTPHGVLERVVRVPMARPTMMAIGAAGEDSYVTSGTISDKPGMLPPSPHDGGLFALRLDVAGLAEPRAL